MENNEIMNYEENEVMNADVVADGGSSMGTLMAMAIGAGIASACVAGAKLVKKGIAKWKDKKELRQPDKEINVEPAQVEEVATPEA